MLLLINKSSDLATKEEFKDISANILDINKKVDNMTDTFSEFDCC